MDSESLGANAETESGFEADARRVHAHFLVPKSVEEMFAELDAQTPSVSNEYQPHVKAFRHSLGSAHVTVAMPFELVATSIAQDHFRRIAIAERFRTRARHIRAGGSLEEEDPGEEVETKAIADSKMDEFVGSKEGRATLMRDAFVFLKGSLDSGLEPAARELLQQGLVLLWSAFEVLCRDVFETALNENPTKVAKLVGNPSTRNRFEAERLSLDVLVEHGFDLSARLGTVLIRQQDFSHFPTIKAVYGVLFPEDNLLKALADRKLWELYQRRHLVVHRRGLVDRAYLEATGQSHQIGTPLPVTPQEFKDSLKVVIAAGAALAVCLSAGEAR